MGYRNTALKIDCFLYIKWRPLNPSLLRENTNCFSPIFYIRLRALQGEDRSPQRARIRKRKLSTLFIILFNNKSGVFQWSPKYYTRKHLFLPCEYTKLWNKSFYMNIIDLYCIGHSLYIPAKLTVFLLPNVCHFGFFFNLNVKTRRKN